MSRTGQPPPESYAPARELTAFRRYLGGEWHRVRAEEDRGDPRPSIPPALRVARPPRGDRAQVKRWHAERKRRGIA